MKKISALLLVAVMALSMLPVSAEHAPVTLQVSIVETDWLDAWEDGMKPAFEAEYPWITLEAVSLGEEKRDYHSTHAAANDLPPVMQTDVGGLYYELVDAGMILDLTGYEAAAAIPQSYKDAYTYNGVLYGLTQGAAFDALFINMAILNEVGWEAAPANWDEFIQCCEDVKAAGYDAVTVAGAKNTTMWMPFESIMLNVIGDELGIGGYEEQIRNGTLDIVAYPEIAARLEQLAPYMMVGSSGYSEDDVTAIMTDGMCAMAIAGNWTAANICAGIESATGDAANALMIVPPFNSPDSPVWLAATPESAFGVSKVDDPALEEARDLFFEWVFRPENFKWIQNARGTLPVLTTMTSEQTVLPEAVLAFSSATQNAITFAMSFNNVTSTVNSDVQIALSDLFTGNATGADVVARIQALYSNDPLNG
ncbi:MAG: ABC transporter substrate-binding protein [Clostridia bacterium]|nr:ABC transporter substrate-binding protein [Clostridia bacterium]